MERRRKKRHRDPRYCQIFLDNNALRRNSDECSNEVDEFHALEEQLRSLSTVKSHGVEHELQNVNTPAAAKSDMNGIYTISCGLTHEETKLRKSLREILQGNAKPGKHQADADHLFEAQKYGAGYFITHDHRSLQKRDEIKILAHGLEVVTLSEFLAIARLFKKA